MNLSILSHTRDIDMMDDSDNRSGYDDDYDSMNDTFSFGNIDNDPCDKNVDSCFDLYDTCDEACTSMGSSTTNYSTNHSTANNSNRK